MNSHIPGAMMKTLYIEPMHWANNPNDQLFIKNIPTVDMFLDAWFGYCFEHQIDQNIPRVEQAMPQDSPFEEGMLLWIPGYGLHRLGGLEAFWSIRVPYAKYGVHTRTCSFAALENILPEESIPVSFLQLVQSPLYRCYSSERTGKKPDAYSWVELKEEDFVHYTWLENILAHVEQKARLEKTGFLAYFERRGVYAKDYDGGFLPCRYVGSGVVPMLTRMVMRDGFTNLTDSRNVRYIRMV